MPVLLVPADYRQPPVFNSLPPSWDASETEVVRGSLLLAKVAREVLQRYSLQNFLLNPEETIFSSMKVFMLEHGQTQNYSANEVFRNSVISQFMGDLLAPYTYAVTSSSPALPLNEHEDLEKAAAQFLGASTLFYQYYTDFVALYDTMSFSHPLFARLPLPPLYVVRVRLSQTSVERFWPCPQDNSDANQPGDYHRSRRISVAYREGPSDD